MCFSVKKNNKTNTIHINAEKIGKSEYFPLHKKIIELAKLKNKHISINFGQKTTIDNFLVEMLISCQKICAQNNSFISLCGIDHNMLCCFYLLKLDKYFEFYDNSTDAVTRVNRLVRRRLKAV